MMSLPIGLTALIVLMLSRRADVDNWTIGLDELRSSSASYATFAPFHWEIGVRSQDTSRASPP